VRYTRRQGAFPQRRTGERVRFWIKATGGTIRLASGIFNLILSLNSIISLQINFLFFYFYTKIHDFFFSINRDLVHLIWTQKKKSHFSLS
jgi:hypothetical protein